MLKILGSAHANLPSDFVNTGAVYVQLRETHTYASLSINIYRYVTGLLERMSSPMTRLIAKQRNLR